MRQLRKRFKRVVLLAVVIVAAAFALNFYFNIGDYRPPGAKVPDKKREVIMKKFENDGQKAGQIPPPAVAPLAA